MPKPEDMSEREFRLRGEKIARSRLFVDAFLDDLAALKELGDQVEKYT